MTNPNRAESLARKLLAALPPRRWARTQGVARIARSLAPILGGHADLVTAAAWLHDIGYSPALEHAGFHPLDGTRYLRDTAHASDVLCRLVAHHSGAIVEATERGLADDLGCDFEPPPADLLDALTYRDITTSPYGQPVTPEQRIADILTRYGPATSSAAPSPAPRPISLPSLDGSPADSRGRKYQRTEPAPSPPRRTRGR